MLCCRNDKVSETAAFTLVEVLVATALAGSIMIAALAVLTRMAREADRGEQPSPDMQVQQRLLSLIEADLLNATRFRTHNNGFSVRGVSFIDGETMRIGQAPVDVVYQVKNAGQQKWLLRRQTGVDVMGVTRTHVELVCSGIENLTLVAEGPLQEQSPLADASEGSPMPRSIRARIVFQSADQGGQAKLERVLHLR